MRNYLVFSMAALMIGAPCFAQTKKAAKFTGAAGEVKIITLDPGHFHASLVQKVSYPQVSKDVYVYAPKGFDVNEHLKRIDGFNKRATSPTSWNEIVYTGSDFMEKMLAEKKGNVVVLAGNNRKKTEYIKRSLEAGLNVLSDKPMAINSQNFKLLKECFGIAKQKGVLLYDIMTERNEITTVLQRELSMIPAVYGTQLKGTPKNPAIVKESVHHLFKFVDNKPLTRPDWYFDVTQQGEGIVDVTTHLVDLVQWEAFPGQVIDYTKDIRMLDANRWTTAISLDQYKQVSGEDNYPEFLKKDVQNDTLKAYCNGDILYKIKGVCAKVSVTWNYTFPKGGGDTHFSVMKGSKADLIICQGKEQNYQPELFIQTAKGSNMALYEKTLDASMAKVIAKYPGVALEKVTDGIWHVTIPAKYRIGHEAHFGQVTEHFLDYLKKGTLPSWEVPNMLAKYYVTTSALDMAKAKTKK